MGKKRKAVPVNHPPANTNNASTSQAAAVAHAESKVDNKASVPTTVKASTTAKSTVDELFSKLKKPDAKASAAEQPPDKPQEAKQKKLKVEGNKDDLFGEGPSKARKHTEEGFQVYSEEELNVGKGGDTSLCPFDCDCCF